MAHNILCIKLDFLNIIPIILCNNKKVNKIFALSIKNPRNSIDMIINVFRNK